MELNSLSLNRTLKKTPQSIETQSPEDRGYIPSQQIPVPSGQMGTEIILNDLKVQGKMNCTSIEVNGTPKTAIVPTSKGYNALYCVESPEVWFMDFCSCKDDIDPLFLEVTVKPYKFIECTDGSFQVWGKRKDFKDVRFEQKSEEEFNANEKFLNMNKPIANSNE